MQNKRYQVQNNYMKFALLIGKNVYLMLKLFTMTLPYCWKKFDIEIFDKSYYLFWESS